MRRPIKFRAWDAFRMEMFRVNSLNSYVDKDVDNPLKVVRYQGDSPSQFILMQFTGLTDRNGVEIYEGDMVRYKYPKKEEVFIQIVNWDNQWACFALFNSNEKWAKESDWVRIIESVEVIGNIYQNPELLKGGSPA